jgi:hypothetical protein
MINKADVIERLGSLVGKKLNNQNLHEGLFCEVKHQKLLRRFNLGKYSYIEYKIKEQEHPVIRYVVDISLTGNPNTFRMDLIEIDGKFIIHSEPRISYSYL